MKILQKGYRKIFIIETAFVFALIAGWLFREYPAVLTPLFSFAGGAMIALFAANYGEHREENRNKNIYPEEYRGE